MGPEVIVYPFLFAVIFFEAFVLVTFLSAPARSARSRKPGTATPTVTIIVPCLNEGTTVGGTIESLLALDYPKNKLSIIVVDNGSTDNTAAAIEKYKDNPQVRLIREEVRGKHFAVNAGIAASDAQFIGCLDADSFVDANALREMIPCFDNANVAAATAAMSVHTPQNLLQYMQNAEYIFGIMLRHTLASVNGIYVTPGPFSLYRRQVVLDLGGFKSGHQTEDLEMALRIQRAGFAIENAPRARVYTKAPSTVPKLLRQRTRWTTGFMRNVLFEYRDLVGNKKYGALGLIVLPIGILAIIGGITTFGVSLFLIARSIVTSYLIHRGVPYVFALPHHLPSFDWFYLPASIYLMLAIVTTAASLAMISIAKHVSRTPGSLTWGILAYIFLYGLVAPLWLMRATADVVTGTRRSWRPDGNASGSN